MTNVKALPAKRERTTADLPIIQDMAKRYGLDAAAFVFTFKAVAMPQPHNDPEFVSCCMVAYQHQLNPLTKEIYFMRTKAGPIQAIVSVDGWIKKCNEHPQYDGMEIAADKNAAGEIESMTISIYRKDRSRPTVITEYMDECKANGGPVWGKSPKRMLRNRTICQGGRVAFGFAGLMDRDEFDQWQNTKDITPSTPALAALDLPDIPEAPQELPDEPDDETEAARIAIAHAISPDMLLHLRSVYPEADWENLASEYNAKDDELRAVQQ